MMIDNNGTSEQSEQATRPAMPTDGDGGHFNREDFQNMSDEEREKMREEMMANRPGGSFGGASGGTRQSMTQVSGEIISLEDGVLILKLTDGGSRIVFYSEETTVLKAKESTNTLTTDAE